MFCLSSWGPSRRSGQWPDSRLHAFQNMDNTRERSSGRPRALTLSPFRRKKPPQSKSGKLPVHACPITKRIILITRMHKHSPDPHHPLRLPSIRSKKSRDPNANTGDGYTAPILPKLDFNQEVEHDMSVLSQTTNGTTPPHTTSKPAMPPTHSSSRNVSGPLAVDTATMQPDPNSTTSPWQRANPHAIPAPQNSKTSQYIDKITSENERLRRELRAEKLAREEEAKRVSAARSKAEDSRAEYQHLQVLADANARAIERKDRKLEELKTALETEAKRRKAAEQRADEALKMLGDTRSETQRQLASAYEMKHLAETNAEAARDGYKRIIDSHEKKLKTISEALHDLRRERIEDADKIKRQAIISDQLQHELARRLRTEDKMVDMMGTYKKEHNKEVAALAREAQQMRLALPNREKEAAKLVAEMEETRDKMKWVMTQKKRQDD